MISVDTESEFLDSQVGEWILHEIFSNSSYLDSISEVNNFQWYADSEIGILIQLVVSYYRKHKSTPTKDAIVGNLKFLSENGRLDGDLNHILQRFYDVISSPIDIDQTVIQEAIELFVKKSGMYQSFMSYMASKSGTDGKKRKVSFDEVFKDITTFNDFKLEDDIGLDALTDEGLDTEIKYLTTDEERLPTGLDYLDRVTNGGILKQHFLGTIAAGANVGKSLCSAHLAYLSLLRDRTVCIISLEMDEKVYFRRILSQITGVNIDTMGIFEKDVRKKFQEFRESHPKAKLIIKEFPPSTTSTSQIDNFIQSLEKKGMNIDILFVDYLNLLRPNVNQKTAQQHEKVDVITKELRGLTYTHKFPCITMTQTNRGAMIDVSPKLSDIAQSMGAACNSDLVVTLFTTSDEEGSNVINMTISKSRLGSKNYVPHRFLIDKDTLALVDDGDSHSDDDTSVDSLRSDLKIKKEKKNKNDNERKTYKSPIVDNGEVSQIVSASDAGFDEIC